jgi:sec-independent protein translocase protein TatA
MFPQAMFGLGVPELLIILAVVLLLFGGSRLAGLGKSTGRALKEFKEETKGLKAGETAPPAAPGAIGQNPYQTEAGSTFVQSPQPQGYPQPQGGTPYTQPQGNVPPQAGPPYVQPPQAGGTQPTNDAGPQGYPTERDARHDV